MPCNNRCLGSEIEREGKPHISFFLRLLEGDVSKASVFDEILDSLENVLKVSYLEVCCFTV